jgi:hypothetical protein
MKLTPRIALPLLGVAVLLVAVVGYVLRGAESPQPTPRPGNVNTTPRDVPDPEGVPMSASAKLAGKNFAFVKAFRSSAYRIYPASPGTEYVVVNFRPLPGDAAGLLTSVDQAVRLTAGESTFRLKFVDLPSSDQSQSNGSFAFEVEKNLENFRLTVGTGQTIPLPL